MINQTLFNLRAVWRQINVLKSDELKVRADLPDGDIELIRQQMSECLAGKGGDVSARAHAAKLGETYLDLNDIGRLRFLNILAQDFSVDNNKISSLASELSTQDVTNATDLHQQLRIALRPPSLELLTKFNSLPSGVKFLVDMRSDLRRLADKDDTSLKYLDDNLKALLRSWFDVGFLDLVRLSWSTPASLLEKLIDYEAVHAIRSWGDLKNRLQSDRRCFAFFHPNMPEEPVIFVQVALVNKLSDNIQELLDEAAPISDPYKANTAIFYSISNAQTGLAGVGFGDFLIKRVVADLKEELPNVTTFSTLSPIPGLLNWMNKVNDSEYLTEEERLELSKFDERSSLTSLLSKPNWHDNKDLANTVRAPLSRITAHYLVNEKRKGRALDPVANFHLNNGAQLARINYLADTSAKGIKESGGMMVNYIYNLDEIERNHENYRETAVTATSSKVAALLNK